MISGIGYVAGVRCMVVASDSGIDAGAIQSMGREKLLRAQDIALRKQAAVRAPGGIGGREPAQVPRRRLHPRRHDLLQPRAPLGRRSAGDHRGARLLHRGRRLHARPVRLRDHGARPRQGLPRRPAAAEGRDRRDRHRRRTRRRRSCTPRSRASANTSPRTTPTACAYAREVIGAPRLGCGGAAVRQSAALSRPRSCSA